jgi:hypothetical protein
VVLSTQIAFPSTEDSDETEVLFAFRKLIGLFWELEKSRLFSLLDRTNFNVPAVADIEVSELEALNSLRTSLSQLNFPADKMNDVQAVDISVTLQWLRVILWKLTRNHQAPRESLPFHPYEPIDAATGCLKAISRIPSTAFEAHGPGIVRSLYSQRRNRLRLLILHD